jgi:hypothetical protein
MSNYNFPPRLRASDYSKGKISQDEIIALQIANDKNIADARKAIKMNEPVKLTALETASPEELLQDAATQEANARMNIEKLGFRPQEAAAIIERIRPIPQAFVNLNANFPAIEADLKKRFNPKLLTPTFIVEYFQKYSEELERTGGMRVFNPNNGGLNQLVNTVAELRRVIPDRDQVRYIFEQAQRQNWVSQDILQQLAQLQGMLPTRQDLNALQNLDPVRQQRVIDELLVQFQNLPDVRELEGLAALIEDDRADRRVAINTIRDLVDGMPQGQDLRRNIVEDTLRGIDVRLAGLNLQPGAQPAAAQPVNLGRRQAAAPAVGVRYIGDINTIEEYDDFRIGDKKLFLQQTGLNEFLLNQRGERKPIGSFNRETIEVSNARNLVAQFLIMKGRGQIPGGVFKLQDDPQIEQAFRQVVGQGIKSVLGMGVMPSVRKRIVMGRGIDVKETPSYKSFGKYAIHIPQLEQQDILNVKYKSLGQVPKFKPTAVSDIFRDFLIDLLENGKANVRNYQQISPDERKLFERISIDAGVWNGLGLKRTTTDTDEEENKRFELLKGEYIAGNNNPKVISELRRLVVKMMGDGRIRKAQGTELLMELSI